MHLRDALVHIGALRAATRSYTQTVERSTYDAASNREDRQTVTERYKETLRQTDRRTQRQTDRQTVNQTDRHAARHADT